MPARQPFTQLCQQLARGPLAGRADLHLHTTSSDGLYTPAQVVDLARRSGLAAIAITDHDTLAAVELAQQAAGKALEVVPAVEITAEFQSKEIHLLGFFVDLHHQPLQQALARLRQARAERFAGMVEQFRQAGVQLDLASVQLGSPSLGRRHLAELLVAQGKVGSVREAFNRWLRDGSRFALPKVRLPAEEAMALVRQAGGVAAWAHPAYDGETAARLSALAVEGLGALEVEYPDFPRSMRQALRQMARDRGLAVTGGSDCHGPGKRTVGACTISSEELDRLRQVRGGACFVPSTISSNKA
ncbi:MAG: PHP domain-containing protein [Gemmataceae bacterium]